jgi:hypothetical protein
MTYGVVRAFQVIVNALLCSPEKAGVGGFNSVPGHHHSKGHNKDPIGGPSA